MAQMSLFLLLAVQIWFAEAAISGSPRKLRTTADAYSWEEYWTQKLPSTPPSRAMASLASPLNALDAIALAKTLQDDQSNPPGVFDSPFCRNYGFLCGGDVHGPLVCIGPYDYNYDGDRAKCEKESKSRSHPSPHDTPVVTPPYQVSKNNTSFHGANNNSTFHAAKNNTSFPEAKNNTAFHSVKNTTVFQETKNNTVFHEEKNVTIFHRERNVTIFHQEKNNTIFHQDKNVTIFHDFKNKPIYQEAKNNTSFHEAAKNNTAFHMAKNNTSFHEAKNNTAFHMAKNNTSFPEAKNNTSFHMTKNHPIFHTVNNKTSFHEANNNNTFHMTKNSTVFHETKNNTIFHGEKNTTVFHQERNVTIFHHKENNTILHQEKNITVFHDSKYKPIHQDQHSKATPFQESKNNTNATTLHDTLVGRSGNDTKHQISNLFFRPTYLVEGSSIILPKLDNKLQGRSFLPASLAAMMPFDTNQLQRYMQIYKVQEDSNMAISMKYTMSFCNSSSNEVRMCHASIESMVDFVVQEMGSNVTPTIPSYSPSHNIEAQLMGAPIALSLTSNSSSITCHDLMFPYLVYGCHVIHNSVVYNVVLQQTIKDSPSFHAPYVCHMDTRSWDPSHMAFIELDAQPGDGTICHWVPQNNIIWTNA